jgi:acyl-CoA synthetase (AMP-forming)/AMP-acid ligase II
MSKLRYLQLMLKYVTLLAFKRKTMGGYCEAAAAKWPERVFVRFEDEAITFRDFHERSNRRANFLRAQGVKKGDVVVLMMENRPEYLETVVAVGKLGAIVSNINTNLRDRQLLHSVRLSTPKFAIVGSECAEAFEAALALEPAPLLGTESIAVDTRWREYAVPQSWRAIEPLLAEASPASPPDAGIRSDDMLCYIFTSGTTGLPKAAKINHLRFASGGIGMGWYGMAITPADTIYCSLPLYHSNGLLIAFGSALVNGATFAIARKFSVRRFWEDCAKFGATAFVYIGEVLRYLVNQPPSAADRAHKVTRCLGNGLRPDIWGEFKERFGIPHVREFYAATEGNAFTLNLDDTHGSVGKIILKSSNNLVIVRYDVEREEIVRDANGMAIVCKPGESGELLGKIKMTTPFLGYSDEKESKKKLASGVLEPGDQYFRTGDLLKMDEAGNFYFVDRIGDTYRWKGENVSTNEVAEVLTAFPGTRLANVYGVQIPKADGRAGMTALLHDDGVSFDKAAFYRFVDEKLPAYARPAFVRVRAEMELTGTFKYIKSDLKREGFDPAAVGDPLFVRNDALKTYEPMSAERFAEIQDGKIRF